MRLSSHFATRRGKCLKSCRKNMKWRRKMILFLVLPSTFRNSGFAELTPSRQKKNEFFVLLSTFRNFGRNLKPSLFIGSLGANAIFEVTIWKPSDFRILPRYAYCKTTRRWATSLFQWLIVGGKGTQKKRNYKTFEGFFTHSSLVSWFWITFAHIYL